MTTPPNPSLFSILNNIASVKLVLGAQPLRVFPWNEAPANSKKPYAVYGVYNGNPENYLGNLPDIDNNGTQIDIYAESSAKCQEAFIAIRDALEPHAHMTSYSTPVLDVDTKDYVARLEFDFWEKR